jgi:hypothetical protein
MATKKKRGKRKVPKRKPKISFDMSKVKAEIKNKFRITFTIILTLLH